MYPLQLAIEADDEMMVAYLLFRYANPDTHCSANIGQKTGMPTLKQLAKKRGNARVTPSRTHTSTLPHTYMHIRSQLHILVHAHTHTHTHARTHTHTHRYSK